jgi:hypothetical protein
LFGGSEEKRRETRDTIQCRLEFVVSLDEFEIERRLFYIDSNKYDHYID